MCVCACVHVWRLHTKQQMLERSVCVCVGLKDEKQDQQWVNCAPRISPANLNMVSVSGSVCPSIRFSSAGAGFINWSAGLGVWCFDSSHRPRLTPYAYSSVKWSSLFELCCVFLLWFWLIWSGDDDAWRLVVVMSLQSQNCDYGCAVGCQPEQNYISANACVQLFVHVFLNREGERANWTEERSHWLV